MTAEEAVEILTGNFGKCPSDCLSHCEKCLEEADKLAIEALEKQMPKKPNNIGRFDSFDVRHCNCPRCGGGINSDQRWCPNCGQKIDWEDEE